MKTHRRSSYQHHQGIALVIVLAFLVLLSVLVLTFFTSVGNELIASQSSEASISTRQLAESATNLVMAQIADATAGEESPSEPETRPLAWASQPGMIRTYRDDGSPFRYYKLYSARNMIVAPEAEPIEIDLHEEVATNDVPDDWVNRPATFVDLNAPVQDTHGAWHYPIMHPGAQPLNGDAHEAGEIEGFEIAPPPGYTGTATHPDKLGATYNPAAGAASNPAAMPVRWIYILQDGTMMPAPEGDANGRITWRDALDERIKPTALNPIVGRIAFWTDDDTCKININTASEGTFWDRPWSKQADEQSFARMIPAQNEFQRYPGHPAMTCLSPVLGSLMPYSTSADKGAYYHLVPRVFNGGTYAGTVAAKGSVPSDHERLFATVDELAYAPTFSGLRKGPTASLSSSRAAEVTDLLQKARFFLTAHSRAPDVNLFNKPRISLWPIQAEPIWRNAKDKLIAFCTSTTKTDAASGTTAQLPYYFQRFNRYTGNGRTIFAPTMPSSQHPTMDMDLVPRNRQLFEYLRRLTNSNVPGFGGNFLEKYDYWATQRYTDFSDRDQILTSMLDYIRTNVNSYSQADDLKPNYDYAPTREGGPVPGEAQLVPLRIGGSRGFGRFATVTEAAVVFFRHQTTDEPDKDELRAGLVLEFFNPTPGLPSWSPHVRYEIEGLDQFKIENFGSQSGPIDMGFPTLAHNWVTSRVGHSGHGHTLSFMGTLASFRYYKDKVSDQPKVPGRNGAESEYPFYSLAPIRIPPGVQKFDFTGTPEKPLVVRIYSGYEAVAPGERPSQELLVQTLHLHFPRATGLPMPTNIGKQTWETRMANGRVIHTGDTVRSVEARADGPAAGDLRYLHALNEVPREYFQPHFDYSRPDVAHAHSVRSYEEGHYPGATREPESVKLIPGVEYKREPAAARGLTQAWSFAGPGDFDNATGDHPDGAFVNKADEGNVANADGGYFSTGEFFAESGRTHSPNRQIASAVNFGSLPTGIKVTEYAVRTKDPTLARPWQTLLFNPIPASSAALTSHGYAQGTRKHFGFGTVRTTAANPTGLKNQPPYLTPPDHLFLDLFTMPVVEPYAISEPFSTAGRVNLNYQILPFTYIKRTTALRGVLRSTKLMAIPTDSDDKSQSTRYELNADIGSGGVEGFTLEGDQKGTLWGFQEKFRQGDIFRSASQICDIPLVPATPDHDDDSMGEFWAAHRRTGDNVREGPYGHIYPRVTTKSNTFTVHFRVQALRKARDTNSDRAHEWNELRDQVIGEYRGSTTLERYIDTADPRLPDFADPDTKVPLDKFYRFRIVNGRQFTK